MQRFGRLTSSCAITSAAAVAQLAGSVNASSPSLIAAYGSNTQQRRAFNSHGRMTHEYGFGNKLADVPILSGNSKPLTRDGEWTCSYALTEPMRTIVPKILAKHGFSPVEIERECGEMFPNEGGSRSGTWITVEDFQKTPWFRRFRPNTSHTTYISYECMKILENELVPPSLRNDPYSSLRKRHMEDQFMNERSSEVHAKSIRRADLARQTVGTDSFNTVNRRKYLEFHKEFQEARGGQMGDVNDSYHAWLSAVSKDANHHGQN